MSNAKREQNRVPVKLATEAPNITQMLKVDPDTGALLIKRTGSATGTATQVRVKRDANRVPTTALLDSENETDVWSARCTDDGELLIKSI